MVLVLGSVITRPSAALRRQRSCRTGTAGLLVFCSYGTVSCPPKQQQMSLRLQVFMHVNKYI